MVKYLMDKAVGGYLVHISFAKAILTIKHVFEGLQLSN